jgi:hypothetical protein
MLYINWWCNKNATKEYSEQVEITLSKPSGNLNNDGTFVNIINMVIPSKIP